jgi:cell division protein FtsB
MTSGRIEGYKDYRDVLNRHNKADRYKRMFKLFLLLLFFLALLFFSYFFLSGNTQATKMDSQSMTISRPGVLIYYSPKTENDGKT